MENERNIIKAPLSLIRGLKEGRKEIRRLLDSADKNPSPLESSDTHVKVISNNDPFPKNLDIRIPEREKPPVQPHLPGTSPIFDAEKGKNID